MIIWTAGNDAFWEDVSTNGFGTVERAGVQRSDCARQVRPLVPRIPGVFIVTPIYRISEKTTAAILADVKRAAGRSVPDASHPSARPGPPIHA